MTAHRSTTIARALLVAGTGFAIGGCRDGLAMHAGAGARGTSHPTTTTTTAATPESDAALLGRALFHDSTLSSSGRLSCASCHSPSHAYGPPNALAVQLGGRTLSAPGLRAVPSLRYTLPRTPIWAYPRPTSLVERLTETDNGPAGGFGWDGRFNSLHEQAAFPLLASAEMASSQAAVVSAVEHGPLADRFRRVYGPGIFADVPRAFAAVGQALERFELEDPSLRPYSSRYDRWLDGQATLSDQERRGMALFNDGARGNCASCHLSQRGADGSHPLFTDFQFEAIGVPRNPEIPANRDPRFHDLGLCGPLRTDQPTRTYCGMFKTPTLRNVASRQVFFHNGRFHTLREVMRFYVSRDLRPGEWYPHGGRDQYDDLPPSLRGNVDRKTLPLARPPGGAPVWTDAEIDDVIAFLRTLDDADQVVGR
jgi:cytochrome c peroxidase